MTRRAVAVAVAGLALAAWLAWMVGAPATDSIQLIAIASGGAAVVGVIGALTLRRLRNLSFSVAATIVSLTSVAAVAVGALGAANAMFLASHDLQALWVVVVASATVGVCAAMVLAERVAAASRWVGDAAQRIGDGTAGGEHERPSIREFAEVARQLEDTAARLAAAREREQALDRSRRELVSWVSHDLRTPLAGIRAISEALEDRVVDDQETLDRYHRTLRVEADRLADLVDDLFELSRIHAGGLRLRPESVSLGDLVSDALAAADPLAAAKQVRLSGSLAGDVPELRLSVPEVARVLRNLLQNAIRETPAEGTVEVEAGTADDHVWVTVSDGCGGIPEADLPRVFDTAFRREGARTPSDDARAGLGLAIARGLVEAHDGEISVANHPGGCRFRIRLPVAPA